MFFYEYPTLSYHLKAVFYVIWCFLLCFSEIPFTIDCRITNTHNAVINNHFCNARHERSKSLTYCRRKYREKSFMFQKKPNKVFF